MSTPGKSGSNGVAGGGKQVPKISASSGSAPESHDIHEIIWPEWSDADVNAEKWGLTKATEKAPKSKQSAKSGSATTASGGGGGEAAQFDDPYPTPLPWSLRTKHSWIRPSALYPGTKLVVYSGGGSSMYPDLISPNRHLLHSRLVRAVVSAVHSLLYLGYTHPFAVEWETSLFAANTSGTAWKPWHHVYSLCRAGRDHSHLPQVNSMGRYVVRLYWMGCWRRVVVDDKYPVDATGLVLVPVTFAAGANKEHEMWPALLTKALMKIASLTWTEKDDIVDFDVVTCLTGWISQKINTKGMDVQDIWEVCCGYSDHFTWKEDLEEVGKNKGSSKAASQKGSASSSKKEKSTSKKDKSSKADKSSKGSKSSKESSKTGKSGKSPAAKSPCWFHLIAEIADLRNSEENDIQDMTPCWGHEFLIEQTRNIPLVKKIPDPSKVLAPWKQYRWVDWAVENGLWEKDELLENIKCLKVVSSIRKVDDKTIRDVRKSREEDVIRKSVAIVEDIRKKEKKPTDKRKKGKEDKKDGSAKGGRRKEPIEFVDPSVWCNFHEMGEYIDRVSIYFKPSGFKTNIVVSDIKFNATSDAKTKKVNKKEDKKNKSQATLAEERSIKHIYWRNILMKSRNEPIYLFADSVDFKLTVMSLAHVGNDFPSPEVKKNPEVELPKPVCKFNKCIDGCICQNPSEKSIPEIEFFIDTRTKAHLIVEEYDWTSHSIGDMTLFLNTYGTKSTMMDLAKGRHVKRLWIKNDKPFVMLVLCDTDIKIGGIEEILDGMLTESELLTQSCFKVCSAFGNLIKFFGTPEYPRALKDFYISYMPNVALSKLQAEKIHNKFLKELIKILASINPEDQYYQISRTIKIVMLNPNFRIPRLLLNNPNFETNDDTQGLDCGCADIDDTKLKENAAIKIQAYFKMIFMKKLKAAHDPRQKAFQSHLDMLRKIYLTTFSAKVRAGTSIELLRNLTNNKNLENLAKYFPYYKDLTSVVAMEKFNGEINANETYQWVPITRQTFYCNVSEPIFIRAYMFCALPEYVLRIFNNDNGMEIDRYTNNALVCKYKKNEKGYTILAYGWTADKPFQQSIWNLYLVVEKNSNISPITVNPVLIYSSQLRGNYVPNLDNLICRCVVKVQETSFGTFQLKVSSNNVKIKIQCLDKDGVVLYETIGLTNVLIPVLILKKHELEPNDLEPNLHIDSLILPKKLIKKSKSSIKKKSSLKSSVSLDKRSLRSALSLKRKPTRTKSIPQNDTSTEYIIQAFVLEDSWPLTIKEWQLVETLRQQAFIESELALDSSISIVSSPRKSASLRSTSKKSLISRKTKEKNGVHTKVPENDKPNWILTSVNDMDAYSEQNSHKGPMETFIFIEIDQRRSEEIKEIKRQCFENDHKRLIKGKELRKEFLEKNYINWSPESREKILAKDFSSQFNISGTISKSGSFLYPSKTSVKSTPLRKFSVPQQNICPGCNKSLSLEEFAFLKEPDSLHKMLPPFDVNKYDKKIDQFRWLISPEKEEKLFINIEKSLENFEKRQQNFVEKMNKYLEKSKNNKEFFDKWYADIRFDSLNMMKDNEIYKENYINKLKEEQEEKNPKVKKEKGEKKKVKK